MIWIAVIEDEKKEQEIMRKNIMRYFENDSSKVSISFFDRAENFVDYYKPVFDVVFVDIELPGVDGLKAARKIREADESIIIIFVTNMAQYAVRGYEVSALDFIVKPVSYYDFALKMDRVRKICESKNDVEIVCSDRTKTSRIRSKNIAYVEVKGHYLEYHTADEVLRSYGKISELEEKLKVCDFMRCNNCYLVNPRYIKEIVGFKLLMKNGEELLISHGRKKQFMTEFCEWVGEGKHL